MGPNEGPWAASIWLLWTVLLVLQGIFISRVSEEGPAARAGVRVGDKLLEVSSDTSPVCGSYPLGSMYSPGSWGVWLHQEMGALLTPRLLN